MFDSYKISRRYTSAMLDAVEAGEINKDSLIRDLLGFLSEDEVKDFMRANDYLIQEMDNDETHDDDDYEYDGQPDEAQEWYDFDPDC